LRKFLATSARTFIVLNILILFIAVFIYFFHNFDKRQKEVEVIMPNQSLAMPCTFRVEMKNIIWARTYIVFLKKKSNKTLLFRIQCNELGVGLEALDVLDGRAREYPALDCWFFRGPAGYYSHVTEEQWNKMTKNFEKEFLKKNGVFFKISKVNWKWKKEKGFKGEWLYESLILEIQASEEKEANSKKYKEIEDAKTHEPYRPIKHSIFDVIGKVYVIGLLLPLFFPVTIILYLLAIICLFWITRGMEILVARIWGYK
jgi:hypothetical protein